MDKWRLRAWCKCRYRLFEVAGKAVVVVQRSLLNFFFKEKEKHWTLNRLIGWKWGISCSEEQIKSTQVCQTAVVFLNVLLNFCCTLHDATYAHSRQMGLVRITWEQGRGTVPRLTANTATDWSLSLSQRKSVGSAIKQTCSVRLWGH